MGTGGWWDTLVAGERMGAPATEKTEHVDPDVSIVERLEELAHSGIVLSMSAVRLGEGIL